MSNNLIKKTAHHLKDVKPSKERINLYYKFNCRCYYCGSKLSINPTMNNYIQIDHVHPKSKGGKNKQSNYLSACIKCNSAKGNRGLEEYRRQCQRKAFYIETGINFNEKQLKWLKDNDKEIVFRQHTFYGEPVTGT